MRNRRLVPLPSTVRRLAFPAVAVVMVASFLMACDDEPSVSDPQERAEGPLSASVQPGAFSDGRVRGIYAREFPGTVVAPSCDARRDPSAEFMELQIVMKVSAAGSDVNGFTIDYRVGDDSYTLDVPWRMVGCGSKVDPEMCPR